MSKYVNWDEIPLTFGAQELADILGVHLNTARKLINDGTIHATKVGREWRVTKDEVRRYLGVNSER